MFCQFGISYMRLLRLVKFHHANLALFLKQTNQLIINDLRYSPYFLSDASIRTGTLFALTISQMTELPHRPRSKLMYAGDDHSVPKGGKEIVKRTAGNLKKEEHHESDDHFPTGEPA